MCVWRFQVCVWRSQVCVGEGGGAVVLWFWNLILVIDILTCSDASLLLLLQAADEFFSKLESQKLDVRVLQQVGVVRGCFE